MLRHIDPLLMHIDPFGDFEGDNIERENLIEPQTEEEIEQFIEENTWFTRKVYQLGRGVTLDGIIKVINSKKYSDVSAVSEQSKEYKEYQFYNIKANNKHYGEIISLKVVGKFVVIQNGIDYINPPEPIYKNHSTDYDACRKVREDNKILHYLLFKDIDEYVAKMNASFDAKICPHCGEEIVGKGKFCSNCGATL